MNPDDGRGAVNVAHDERYRTFNAACGSWEGIVTWIWIIDNALKTEDPELSPAGGKVSICNLVDGGKRHLFLIIRFAAHDDWIREIR